ncbi:hypothetical protein EV44_g4330 [Erysiphe necator]|uniref:Uncharacterized protein n=1 Tax=Uncinula necator TaxID=52586 RepID=A0A0B1P6P0_UNCNE|nr:hypothetical protein EV44_g4330 [Erysiphe necator]
MEVNTDDELAEDSNLDPFTEEFPSLSGTKQTTCPLTPGRVQSHGNKNNQNAANLMDSIKGLLDLTDDYLRNLESQHPGVEADFLALLADGASRAMRGERVYCNTTNVNQTHKQGELNTWAEKEKAHNLGTKVFNLKRQTVKASLPQGQSREDRRVMIRLDSGHEARKTGAYELRQSIQNLVSDKSLVSDVWMVPSGVAVLAPTPAKAAAIL